MTWTIVNLPRHLYNIFLGRTGFEEEKLDYEKTKRVLEDLASKGDVSGNMDFHHFRPGTFGTPDEKLVKYFDEKVSPNKARDLFSKYFKIPSMISAYNFVPYFEGTHQTYYGRHDEVHYLDVGLGIERGSKKRKIVFKRKPRRRLTKVSKMRFTVRKKG